MLPSNNNSRQFSETHISEDCRTFFCKEKENALFFDCLFEDLNGVTLKNCDLNKSKISPTKLKHLLNFTLTLNCHSFKNVELNELAFDLLLSLLTMTKGNDLKRAKIVDILGKDRYNKIMKILGELE